VIPLRDENPTVHKPVITLLIIGACLVVYFLVQPAGQGSVLSKTSDAQVKELRFDLRHAAIPDEVTSGRPLTDAQVEHDYGNGTGAAASVLCDAPLSQTSPCAPRKNVYLAILYSMFLHGSLLHIGGNMLFLWVFGNNIEDRMGKFGFLAFYLVGGLVAALAHIFVQPNSTVPVVGASGAIAAVMGAYLVLFPDAPIRTIIIFYLILFRDISAKWLLAFWFVSQFFINPNEGVAWVAHVGGFVFGALVALVLRRRLAPPLPRRAAWDF
jgi:membrane associated rhomboid family serine protease